MPRVNLVIACYGGPRRTYDKAYEQDRSWYLWLQLADSLQRFKHNLAQITIVNNGGEDKYLEFLRNNSSREGCVFIHRENIGMSYGAFNAAWQADKSFDYYIFLEDDYLFVIDDFDSKMIEAFESATNCGYLCQLVFGFQYPYPAIINGITSREVLIRLGRLPGADVISSDLVKYYGQCEAWGQVGWGKAIKEIGMLVHDMGARFRAPFQDGAEFLCWYPHAPEYLMVPAQIYQNVIDNPNYVLQYPSTDEDWRKLKHYYMVMRNLFIPDEHRPLLEKAAAPLRIRTREDLARVVSIYEGMR